MEDVDGLVGGAAEQRAHAREQLGERERLDDVVVGAGIEPRDAVGDLVARRQHQHRQAAAAPPEPPADLEAVDVRHQHVEHDEIGLVAVALQPLERLGAVGGELDLVALEPERAAERLAHRRVVVDDEDSHASYCCPSL